MFIEYDRIKIYMSLDSILVNPTSVGSKPNLRMWDADFIIATLIKI